MTGDAALIAVSEALRATFRRADVVAGLGGDEFAALIVPAGLTAAAGEDASDRLHVTAQGIRGRLEHHLKAAKPAGMAGDAGLAASVGLAHTRSVATSGAGGGIATLLADADATLYADKRRRTERRAHR